jgi:heparan-sulfate lyase
MNLQYILVNIRKWGDQVEAFMSLVQPMKQKGLNLREEKGQVSFVYARKQARPAFRYSLRKETKEKGVRFVTVVTPYNKLQPKVNVRIIGKPKIGASHIELEIVNDDITRRIGYDL